MKQWNVNWEIRQVKLEQLFAFSHYIPDTGGYFQKIFFKTQSENSLTGKINDLSKFFLN